VYVTDESVDILVELLQIYRDKGTQIFNNACMLLGIMGFDDDRRQVSYYAHLIKGGHKAGSPFFWNLWKPGNVREFL